jgi:hypothetical protein
VGPDSLLSSLALALSREPKRQSVLKDPCSYRAIRKLIYTYLRKLEQSLLVCKTVDDVDSVAKYIHLPSIKDVLE